MPTRNLNTNLKVTGSLELEGILYDGNSSAGTNGQVLSSTSTGTDWVTLSEISGVDGTGTANYLSKWLDANTITNSLVYDNGTNVGIGTTNPTQKLDVAGTVKATSYFLGSSSEISLATTGAGNVFLRPNGQSTSGQMQLESSGNAIFAGNISIPQPKAFTFANSQTIRDNGGGGLAIRVPIYRLDLIAGTDAGNGHITFQTNNGTERMRVSNGGNVGIGTTSPNDLLEVYGSSPDIRITNTAETDSGIVFNDAQAGTSQMAAIKFNSSDEKLKFFVNDEVAQRMVIDTAGNVGIGTTNPSTKLNLYSNGTDTLPQLTIQQDGAGDAGLRFLAGGNAWSLGVDNSGGDYFGISNVNYGVDTGAEFVITQAGNVGIGTAGPSYKLDIAGNAARIGNNLQTTTSLFLTATNTAGSPARAVQTVMAGYEGRGIGTFYTDTTYSGEEWFCGMNYSGNFDRWSVGYDPSGGQPEYFANVKFTVNSSGNVGIGTTSPNYKLDVNGEVRSDAYRIDLSATTQRALSSTGTDSLLVGDAGVNDIKFKNAAGNSVIIASSGKVGIGVPDPVEMLELGAGGKIGLTDSAGTYDSVIYNDGSTFKVADGAGSYHVDKINLLGLLDLGVGHTIKGINDSIIANKDILAPRDGSFGFRTYGASSQYDAISSQFIDNNNNALSFNVKAGGTTSEAVRIDKDGNVGIGITNPDGVLHIKKDNATATFEIQGGLNTQTTAGAVNGEINFGVNDPSTSGGIGASIKNISQISNGAHNGLAFFTGLQSRTPYLQQMLYLTAQGGLSFGTTNGAYGTSGQILKSNGDAPPTWVAASTVIGGPYLPLAGGTMTGNLNLDNNVTINLGANNGLQLYHNGSHSLITNQIGDLYIRNQTNDGDIRFQADDGLGGDTEYFRLDGGAAITVFSKEARFTDNVKLKLGSGPDFEMYHNGSHSYIHNDTGNIYIENDTTDGDIFFKSDNGSGGLATYLKLDGGSTTLQAYKDLLIANDTAKLKLGASQDLQIYHDGSDSYIRDLGTGELRISGSKTRIYDADLSSLQAEFTDGGSVDLYYDSNKKFETTSDGVAVTNTIDVGSFVYVGGNNSIFGENNLRFKSAGAAYIDHNTVGQSLKFRLSNSSSLDVTPFELTPSYLSSSVDMYFGDNDKIRLGASSDLQIYHDGSNSIIKDAGAGGLFLLGDGAIYLQSTTGENMGKFTKDGAVELYYDNSKKFETLTSGVKIVGTNSYIYGGDNEILAGQDGSGYYFATGNGQNVNKPVNIGDNNSYIRFKSGNSERMRITSAGNVGIGTTSPAANYKLHVAGGIKATNFLDFNNNYGVRCLNTSNSAVELIKLNSSNQLQIGSQQSNSNPTLISGSYITLEPTNFLGIPVEAVRVIDGGNVGIGTASPSEKLDVVGRIRGERFRTTTGGSASFAAYYFLGDSDTGAFQPANNTFGITTAGTERMRIDSSGNVGIGTTNPTQKLHVSGNVDIDNGGILFQQGYGINLGVSGYDIWMPTTTRVGIQTAATERLSILNNGNVGIGTTSPTEKLHVEGNIELINGGYIGSLDGSYWQRLRFEDATPSTTNAFNFETRNGSGSFIKHMVIRNDGNVGIGVTNPSYALQVGGSIVGTSKNFIIDHPTKEGKKLLHACIEGPEAAVYFRGKSTSNIIEMPDYWIGLVDIDTMTVDITAIGPNQDIYVESIADNGEITIAANTEEPLNYFYVVYGERKDIGKLDIEIVDPEYSD
jgi:hypothetical protein